MISLWGIQKSKYGSFLHPLLVMPPNEHNHGITAIAKRPTAFQRFAETFGPVCQLLLGGGMIWEWEGMNDRMKNPQFICKLSTNAIDTMKPWKVLPLVLYPLEHWERRWHGQGVPTATRANSLLMRITRKSAFQFAILSRLKLTLGGIEDAVRVANEKRFVFGHSAGTLLFWGQKSDWQMPTKACLKAWPT